MCVRSSARSAARPLDITGGPEGSVVIGRKKRPRRSPYKGDRS
jgi:hypothetical protein